MTVEEMKFPEVKWETFLRQSQNSEDAMHYFDKKEWFSCLYIEKFSCHGRHHIEMSATINYMASKNIDVISAMKNGTFKNYRDYYTCARWKFNDFDGKTLVTVSIDVRKNDICAVLTYPDGSIKELSVGTLLDTRRDLDDIVTIFKRDFRKIFDELRSKDNIWTIAVGNNSFEPTAIDKKSGQTTSAIIKVDTPMNIVKGEREPSENLTIVRHFPIVVKQVTFGWVLIVQNESDKFCAHYFNTQGEEIHKEFIGSFDRNDPNSDRKKVKEEAINNFLFEYESTIYTLQRCRIDSDGYIHGFYPAKCKLLVAFVAARRHFVIKSVVCLDKEFKEYLTYELSSDDCKFIVRYKRKGQKTLEELVGSHQVGFITLRSLCNEFENDFELIYQECERQYPNKSRSELYDHFHEVRKKRHIDDFAAAIKEYIEMFLALNEHRVAAKEIDPKEYLQIKTECDGGVALTDWDIPPQDVLWGTIYRNRFFKSKNHSQLPTTTAVENAYRRLILIRHRHMCLIRDFAFVKSYTLYKANKLAALKINGTLEIINSDLFNEAKKIQDDTFYLRQLDITITDQLIDKAIANGIVPKSRRADLARHNGDKFFSAVLRSGMYGNFDRQISILKDLNEGSRPEDVSEVNKVVSHLQSQGMRVRIARDVAPQQVSDQFTLSIYQYLQGEIKYEDLRITDEHKARRALAIVKMFDIGIHIINCSSQEKYQYEIVSEELRTKIVEKFPAVQTYEAFTRLLNTSDVDQCMSALVPSREATHGKIECNNLLMLKWSEGFLNAVSGVGGNSAAGKTVMTQGKTISVDKWKYILRMGTEILNTHVEGSHRFNAFLKFIIEQTDYNYTLDLRFLEPRFVRDNIIEAAKFRGVPGKMIYLIRPLATSLLRMLTRDPHGKEPAQQTSIITSGYKALHTNFAAIIELMDSEEAITEYDIYYKHGAANECIASKREGKSKIFNPLLFDSCKIVPEDPEIKAIEETLITEVMIRDAVNSGDIFKEQADDIRKKFLGQKLGDAVNNNARGGK